MPDSIISGEGRSALPTLYYHRHFTDFLDGILAVYSPVLGQRDHVFITDFRRLDLEAQCLYVRMMNRRGRIFDGRAFRYREIPDPRGAIGRLQASGFARAAGAVDFPDWLDTVTRPVLLTLLRACFSSDRYRQSWKKREMTAFARANLDPECTPVRAAMAPYLVQRRAATVSYLLYLYFGRKEDSLQRFTLKDLGVVSAAGFRSHFKPRFSERDVAQNNWFYCRKLDQVSRADETVVAALAEEAPRWPAPLDDNADRQRQQALYRLGERVEKLHDTATAERVFSIADGWPASERRVRLMFRRGDREGVLGLLDNMLDQPCCEEELLFAEDFRARKFRSKRTARVTDILRQARVLEVDESRRGQPERAAADWYRQRGAAVWFSENRLWNRLFGLLFWDVLFVADDAALYNEFEKRPADLVNGTFHARHRDRIERELGRFADPDRLWTRLAATATANYGRLNGIFRWSPGMLAEIQACLGATPARGLETMMRRMACDWTGNRSGYPDLMVIEDGRSRFVEIKSDGDQLRRNQLKQITAMERAGIPVEVNRVAWSVDPAQVYAVVDIETTGRRGGANRITEIGIVRLRGETVLDRWQSLVNPGRPIPRRITEITGISDAMVVDSPAFADIAPTVQAKCDGAVFVAHNVQFDYGFMVDEFRRLGVRFHAPTLCTVSGMRRWYPGLRSYSLASLCRHFDIDLPDHHRAMCDAEAAATLLKLMNQRRTEGEQAV